ncbi:hypothetical protein [uncultured Methylobacterium sp.]|jgi:hypothetical protein|uniref:hypothetical protein n=1 Tax=uncultured Methylobacterium sp. TaxID=157278 RepID=UPI002614C47E|nr:hypothetical protein [uncultured Methylobacterium sp.]
MADEPADLTLQLLREMRAEMREQRKLLLTTIDYSRRLGTRIDQIEHKIIGLREDLELMIRAELMGALAHRDTLMDERLDRLADRVAELEGR